MRSRSNSAATRVARPSRSAAVLVAVTVAVLGLAFAPAQAQDGHGYGGRPVSHEGWYTEEQAARGREAYATHCARCHLVGLDGVVGQVPPLVGPEFLARWEGAPVHRLFHYTRSSMPLDAPGTLTDPTYLDILAYVLHENGLPPGDVELRPSADQLSRLVLHGTGEADSTPTSEEEPPEAE